MDHSVWGWLFWIGFWFLFISSFGNWGYSYRIHRKYNQQPTKNALEILNERYARGEIEREEYATMKVELAK